MMKEMGELRYSEDFKQEKFNHMFSKSFVENCKSLIYPKYFAVRGLQ